MFNRTSYEINVKENYKLHILFVITIQILLSQIKQKVGRAECIYFSSFTSVSHEHLAELFRNWKIYNQFLKFDMSQARFQKLVTSPRNFLAERSTNLSKVTNNTPNALQ